MRSRVVVLPAIVALLLLVTGGVLLSGFREAFPLMRPGLYVGTLESLSNSTAVPWAIEVSPGGSDVSVAVGDARVPALHTVVSAGTKNTRLPLIVGGSERRLRITGREAGEGKFEGEYSDEVTSDRGKWHLQVVVIKPYENGRERDLKGWAITWRALRAVEQKIEEAQGTFDGDGAKLDSLRRSADGLKDSGESNNEGRSTGAPSLEAIRGNIAVKKSELAAILNTLDISERVSAEGRLVEMSRESIQREGRWIEKVLKLTAPDVSEGFEVDYERARAVKALQDQIADERGLIRNLAEAPAYREKRSEAESEEEFYNGLR
jgi:hypothetical protein